MGDGEGVEGRTQLLETEMLRQRDRTHKLVDALQVQEGRVAKLEWEMGEVKSDIAKHATAEQLKALTEMVTPIRTALNWIVALVIGGFVAALLSLVLRRGG